LDAVMKEPVLIQHDDDVEVYNRPAASEYYHTQPPPSIEDEMWIENSVFICYNIL